MNQIKTWRKSKITCDMRRCILLLKFRLNCLKLDALILTASSPAGMQYQGEEASDLRWAERRGGGGVERKVRQNEHGATADECAKRWDRHGEKSNERRVVVNAPFLCEASLGPLRCLSIPRNVDNTGSGRRDVAQTSPQLACPSLSGTPPVGGVLVGVVPFCSFLLPRLWIGKCRDSLSTTVVALALDRC
ncbi:hypothetical protein LX36DRAFT_319224 [Colletotrichum falcatum]|nr:hypothetical protein LX36DRAFT_319224 [Colletotrichum falcatum]